MYVGNFKGSGGMSDFNLRRIGNLGELELELLLDIFCFFCALPLLPPFPLPPLRHDILPNLLFLDQFPINWLYYCTGTRIVFIAEIGSRVSRGVTVDFLLLNLLLLKLVKGDGTFATLEMCCLLLILFWKISGAHIIPIGNLRCLYFPHGLMIVKIDCALGSNHSI